MTDSPSPAGRRLTPPSWLNPRLLSGVLLVLLSVGAGAGLLSSADRSVLVWAVARDLAAGTVLTPEDLRPARVRLFESAPGYLGLDAVPTGRTVTRRLAEGELLPAAALATVAPGVVVNIPVPPANAPALARGQSVDVWAAGKDCGPERVLAGVPVQEVRAESGALSAGAGTVQVVVRVGSAEAERVLAALSREVTVRLVVVQGDLEARAAGPLTCARDR